MKEEPHRNITNIDNYQSHPYFREQYTNCHNSLSPMRLVMTNYRHETAIYKKNSEKAEKYSKAA